MARQLPPSGVRRAPARGASALAAADAAYMAHALQLARKAIGRTSPNPLVGAVIVKDGEMISTGYHHSTGLPHAEALALRQAGLRARGATLYTTLEPCDHVGRTPPCTDAIVRAGIARVVVAAVDPNPITNGRGIARLRRAGVPMTVGVMRADSERLNEPFRKAMVEGLPYAIAKIGQSLDGKIATNSGASRWITSPASRRLTHQLRSRVDAVVVGVNTVLKDNPRLTVRGASTRSGRPIRVIVDTRLRTPHSARCLSIASTPVILATANRSASRMARYRKPHVEIISLAARRGPRPAHGQSRGGRVPLRALFRLLAARGIQSVLIEGGGELLAGALRERLVDHVAFFIAPTLIGGRRAPSAVGGEGITTLKQALPLADVTYRRIGPDMLVEARVVYPR